MRNTEAHHQAMVMQDLLLDYGVESEILFGTHNLYLDVAANLYSPILIQLSSGLTYYMQFAPTTAYLIQHKNNKSVYVTVLYTY